VLDRALKKVVVPRQLGNDRRAEYLLDTNVFNRLVDMGVDPAAVVRAGALYVTHIQHDELQATRRSERAAALLEMLSVVKCERVPTAAAVWNVSNWGEAQYGDADGGYSRMLDSLNRRNSNKRNNAQDVLTAITALKRGLILVTDDADLADVFREFGDRSMSFSDFAGSFADRAPAGSDS
jgi:predicted nucleic acid-binding protein